MENTRNQDNAFVEFHMHPQDDATDCRVATDIEPFVGDDSVMMETFEGDADIEPYEGMVFESEDAARIFYNAYARRVGFGSRISRNRRSRKDGKTIARRFVCCKEGFRAKKHQNKENRVKRPRAITREGCQAMMMVKKTELGKWVVSKFTKDHNHTLLSPNEVIFLRSHRSASNPPNCRIRVFDGAKMGMSNTMTAFNPDSSGVSNIGFTRQECGNHNQIGPKRRQNLGRDTENVLDYFKRKKSENVAFFYAIEVYEGRSSCSMFWADARARMACHYFGDVVYIDVTYKSNRYGMPFVVFTGVNNHQQCTSFGCALLLDDTESSFVWLFRTWLGAMSGRFPDTIVTDQDPTIGEAIAQVFPNTRHAFCRWHILNKAPKQLSHVYYAHPAFQAELEKCFNLTETIEEFESCWGSLITRYELRENEWIQSLYLTRQRWAPVYLRETFFAPVSASQRNECINLSFDGYMNESTALQEFVMLYERTLDGWYEKELEEDVLTEHAKPDLKTRLPIEEHAADIYTRTVFLKFQEEVSESLGYVADKFKEDTAMKTYRVAKYEEHRKAHTVTFNVSEKRASCNCQMFEFSGILCRHALKVLEMSNVTELPSHYILDRWTRNAKSVVVLDERGIEMQANCQESENLRYNKLCMEAIRCVEEGATSGESYDVALYALRAAWEKIVSSKERLARAAHIGTTVVNGGSHAPVVNGGSHAPVINSGTHPLAVHSSSHGDIISGQCEVDDTTNHLTLCDPHQWHSWQP
ncbi:protein FAR1-RELATED SEQUENCE 5-like [Magnolia sinica]|uniref:protein FAR1-RELATED SEQUENCE 5-like n=1 Tax=Magnolia sinica TaxID=86752 RepID=UPI0026599171|nr:protein FAR1-RELATED SEQUENCE 5-like [Magnolia sinica]